MALTRKLLRELGLDEEAIGQIIAAHTESTDALKAERDAFSSQLDAAKAEAERERTAFSSYRAEQEAGRLLSEKRAAYRSLLSRAGIAERYLDSVLRVSDLSSLTLENGKIPGEDEKAEAIRREFSDFIMTAETSGTRVPMPPASAPVNYDAMSDADYYAATYKQGKASFAD